MAELHRLSPSGKFLPPVVEGLRNLTNVAFVDNGAPPPAIPDGNIESPYTTFNAANVANKTSIYVVPGNYVAEGPVSFIPPGCSVIGMGLAPQDGSAPGSLLCPLLPDLDLSPPPFGHDFYFENVRVLIVGASGNVSSVTFRNCVASSTEAGSYFTFVEGGSFDGVAGSQGIIAKGGTSLLGVNLTTGAGFNRFTNWEMRGQIIFSAAGGTVELDVATVQSLKRGSNAITDGGVKVLDGPRLQFTWGANAANSADFLVPYNKGTAGAAALTALWLSHAGTPGPAGSMWAHTIHAQLSTAHAEDVVVTLFVGATIGAAAATALTVTIPAGQLQATFDLTTELVIVSPGNYMGVQYTSAAALATELDVTVGGT